MRAAALLLAALLFAVPAQAGPSFRGEVTHVTDGDTLWVRPQQGGAPVQIRLLDLDAPEGCQAHGPRAKQALRERVLHQRVQVRPQGLDDYGRQLARVRHRREDVGAWLVREGHAWSMTFRGKPGPYAPLEAQARRERRGLWARPGALDPRSFRQRHGRCE
ncbi:MAG TPA: thermonuclease family protein [Ramlibacter sp.]|uniref:thermonuclease family protein n=1 Tax=Ramlibacter sp. TaxID=1917967 RepID=UPI002D7E5DAF|nr:thermonuclease family protein [Ramlibacter sp.]HET8744222.1 thermonuclease family protein [Ramlibacter sp.]